MQRDWWWYCSHCTCDRFSFCPHQGLNWGISGSLVLHSTTAPWLTSGFYLWQFQVFISSAEGLVVILIWLDLCDRFYFCTHTGVWTRHLWISSPALYQCTTTTSGFHLWQFQVFNSGAEELVVVLFWLVLWDDFLFACFGVWTGDIWMSNPALYHYAALQTSGFHLWQFQVC